MFPEDAVWRAQAVLPVRKATGVYSHPLPPPLPRDWSVTPGRLGGKSMGPLLQPLGFIQAQWEELMWSETAPLCQVRALLPGPWSSCILQKFVEHVLSAT